MQKKIIAAAALVLALTLLFVACGKGPTIVTKEGNEYPLMTDAEGNTVVNENGDLVIYVTDENGKYVEDANGEPQTNAVTFPDQIVDGKTIETSLYSWTLPDGWSFDDDGKAVKDGTDGKVYVKFMEAATTENLSLTAYVTSVYNTYQEQAERIKSSYPDTTVTLKDVQFSSTQTAGKSLVFQIKDETGKVMHYAEGIYFEANGVIYKIEYAGLDGYYDANVDLYAMLQTLTLKA